MRLLSEFFQDDRGHGSMSRLLCFLAFFPASYVVIVAASADALAWYLGAFVAGYVGGKITEDKNRVTRSKPVKP